VVGARARGMPELSLLLLMAQYLRILDVAFTFVDRF
jgi:hypothetical protein